MFDIEYKGGNSVIIATKQTTVAVDPKLSLVGLKDLAVKNNVEVATESRFLVADKEARLIIESPGEYEIGDFSMIGVAATRHIDTEKDEKVSTLYRLEVGDVRIALLGNIAPKLSEEQLETLGVVDILIIPVGGGGYTLDATNAATLTRQIDPKVVIPVHYADPALFYEVPQEDIQVFVKELGVPVEKAAKYKVKSSSALPEALTVVELARS
jgi:L-ascorbate metabolism protein UlaG (beta-lactamase superfamily)